VREREREREGKNFNKKIFLSGKTVIQKCGRK
jgi:hypothetical protein